MARRWWALGAGRGPGRAILAGAAIMLLSGAILAAAAETWRSVPGSRYRKVHGDGYGNCLFASEEISPGQESALVIQNDFSRPAQVYARCYFAEPVGALAAEDFWHEIWIDGKIVKRTVFTEPPDPGADQTQIWVTEDDYAGEMAALAPGVHEVTILVMKNARGESGKVKWTPVKLARGDFKYLVP
jgi:hypothetical protein